MREESTTPDVRELARQLEEAFNRGDFDAVIGYYAPDAVWVTRVGTRLEGVAAIRGFMEEISGSVEDFRTELLEWLDLRGGVIFSVTRQGGRPGGSKYVAHEQVAYASVVVDGLFVSQTTYSDIDEARAAAERLAEERADG